MQIQQEHSREQCQAVLIVPNVGENKERLVGVYEVRKATCLGHESLFFGFFFLIASKRSSCGKLRQSTEKWVKQVFIALKNPSPDVNRTTFVSSM